MNSIGARSVNDIASSVASSIAGGELSATAKAAKAQQGPSIGESIKSAFDGLIKAQQNQPSGSSVAAMEPFSPPDVPADGVMGSLREAIGSFRDLAGGKQKKWNIDASDQQRSSDFDMQRVGVAGKQQLGPGSDAQRVSDLGGKQLGSDAQRVSDLGGKQLEMDAQRVSDLGSQQLGSGSDAQRMSDLGGKQLEMDAQRVSDLGGQQFSAGFDQQRTLQPGGADLAANSSALKMLDSCNKFFGLLDQLVTGDQDIALKTTQVLR